MNFGCIKGTGGQQHKHEQPTVHVDSRITKLVKREGIRQPGECMECEYAYSVFRKSLMRMNCPLGDGGHCVVHGNDGMANCRSPTNCEVSTYTRCRMKPWVSSPIL